MGETPTPISRREFLARSGRTALLAGLASQAGWLVACSSSSPVHKTTGANWDALEKDLTGTLTRPGDPAYAKLSLPFNRRYADVKPAGIARVANAEDIRRCVTWAAGEEVPIVARSGGHSYGGYSTTTGLIVDVGDLRSVNVDDDTRIATVGAGARNTNIYAGLEPHDVAFSAGRCPSVGVSGLTLGGGFGFSSRTLGLTADALRATEMVTPDGTLTTVTAESDPDLFWALRGGGGGNFGINASFSFQAQPVKDVAVFEVTWPWTDAAPAMHALQSVLASAPTAFSMRMGVGISGLPPTPGAKAAAFSAIGQYFGPADELREILAGATDLVTPRHILIESMSFWKAKTFFFKTTPINMFQEKSSFIVEPVPEKGFATLADWTQRWPGSHNEDGAGAAMFSWGGAISDTAADETAFVHRDAMMLLAFSTTWTADDDQRTVDAGLAWLEEGFEEMQPFVAPQSYQNFIDPTLADWQQAYYGSNLDRLIKVRSAVDPEGMFSFPQAIPRAV